MDIVLIFCWSIFAILILFTIEYLMTCNYLIDRYWWDKDFERNGKTTFKSGIKATLIALLLNGIGYLILYLMVGVMGLNPIFFLIPFIIFIVYLQTNR